MKNVDSEEFLVLISQEFPSEEGFAACVMVWISGLFNSVLGVLQQFQSRRVFNRSRAFPWPLDCIVSLPLIWGGDLKRHSMCGLQKKGCIHSYKHKRSKLLFSIDISGPCGVISECWGSHRSGKSLAKQNNSCPVRAGKLGPSNFTVSKFE